MNFFNKIKFSDWRQFGEIDLDLSRQVTVVTGQNGSGKTTILHTLSRHFGWNVTLVASPYFESKKGRKLWTDFRAQKEFELETNLNASINVGTIAYDNGETCKLSSQAAVSTQYSLKFENQQPVIGLHIPSHRPTVAYSDIPTIPTNPTTTQQHYQNYVNLLQQTYGSGNVPRNPGVVQKESIISLAVFGFESEVVKPNLEFQRIYKEFEKILSIILPPEIGFINLEIQIPEVVLVTKSGNFVLDAMSGGVNSLFSIAWQIHMFGTTTNTQTVTITFDEPENHLHPSMQRSLLPSLSKAFPQYRFIVATHSPFIVTSFPDASVYGLVFDESRRVNSHQLSAKDLSGTPNRVLREILDVPSNLPLWVEEGINALLRQNRDLPPEQAATIIMNKLRELGLTESISEYRGNEKTD